MAKSYFEKLLSDSENRYGEGGTDFASPEDRIGNTYAALEGELQGMMGESPQIPMIEQDMEEPEVEEQVNDIVESQNAPVESPQDDMVEQAVREIASAPVREQKPELTPQEQLLEEFRKYRTQQLKDVESARSTDDKIELLNQLNKSFVQANKALGSGFANVDPRALDIGSGDLEDKTRKDYQDRLQNMMQEYKILSAKDEDQLSARDKAYLDYYNKKLGFQAENLERQEDREQRISRKQQLDAARGLIKDDPRTKKAFEQAMALEDIQPLVEQVKAGNQNAAAALGTRLARAMGEVGVLTDADVTRYVQGTSWGRKLLDWYKKGAEGSPSPETLEEIVKNSKTISSKLQGNLKKVYENASSRMKTAYPDLDDKTIQGLLGKPEFGDSDLDPKIQDYADKFNLTYDKAERILKARGYNGR